MQAIGEAGLALAMIAALLLGVAGVRWALHPNRVTRKRGLLMIAAAIVLVADVLIWTL
ncbi:MAG: hypothetical protein ABIR77_01965 [Sphingomicrobium sp.]